MFNILLVDDEIKITQVVKAITPLLHMMVKKH